MEHPHQVVGRVKRVLFSSEEEAHSIVLVAVKEKNFELKETELVITGTGVGIELGGTYQAFGRLVDHPRFGKQLKAELIRRSVPMTKHATIRFLTNGSFTGIGPKTAKNIVDALGEEAVDLILKDERVLNQVPGLKQKQADIILSRLATLYGVDQLMLFLAPFDVTPKLAAKIYAAYEGDAMARIRENPYSLMYEVNGVGFKTADHIASHLGLVGLHPERVAASIMHILEQEAGEGHAFATVDSLLQRAPRLLGEDPGERLEQAIELLLAEDKVKLEEGCLYLPTIFYAEVRAAKELARVMANGAEQEVDVATILEAIGHLEEQFGMEYAAQQREAIELAVKAPLMVLTGGPGTGKTTVIKGILHALQEIHDWPLEKSRVKTGDVYPYVLVAPTGRAAKRLSEATDVPAMTIHRLLKYDGTNFQLNEDQPITGKVLIIDESSMIDIYLLSSLLRAVPNGMKILFVGDRDQLPSVGPGQVLADLMDTEGIPVVRLNVIHRQAEDSSILRLAHDLKNRTTSADLLSPLADRRFYTASPQETLRGISAFAEKALAKGYSKFDVQVLAPTYRGQVGIDELNVALQRVYNPEEPKKREVKQGTRIYRTGDKILQLVNNAEENVYNGDIGEIVNIFFAKENVDKVDKIIARFDQTEVEYNRSDWDQFTHAYAITIHKAQGSEFPIVLMPVYFTGAFKHSRNLIYTAVTRAKSSLLLFGDPRAFHKASQEEEPRRRTRLIERLGGVTKT